MRDSICSATEHTRWRLSPGLASDMLEQACHLYQHVETWLIAFGVEVCCSALKVQVRELTRDKLGVTADVSAVVEVNGHSP